MAEIVNIPMKRQDILNVFSFLSKSQGFYGRLLRDLMLLKDNDEDKYEALMDMLEEQEFITPVDVIIFVEG